VIKSGPLAHTMDMAIRWKKSCSRAALGAGLLLSLALVSACGDEDTSLGGGAQASCQGQNWRQPTTDSVVCPGAPDCSCGGGQVCCIDVVNGKATSGSCGELTQCAGLALTCDGSEDCPTGQVCCLLNSFGGGSECRNPQDCFFTDEITACRGDSECSGIEHCEPSQPGSLLAGVVAGCTL